MCHAAKLYPLPQKTVANLLLMNGGEKGDKNLSVMELTIAATVFTIPIHLFSLSSFFSPPPSTPPLFFVFVLDTA